MLAMRLCDLRLYACYGDSAMNLCACSGDAVSDADMSVRRLLSGVKVMAAELLAGNLSPYALPYYDFPSVFMACAGTGIRCTALLPQACVVLAVMSGSALA